MILSCMSFLSGGQLSTDKLVLQFVYIYKVWAGIKMIPAQTGNGIEINSSPNRKWNYDNVHKSYKYFVS